MNFIAIDFETANEKRHSPCSLGLTVVKDSQIIEEKYWLIKPKECRFAPMNIMIHGIREQDVKDAPEFNEIWEEVKPYLEGQLVIAHNASFDLSVLRRTLDLYDLAYPSFDYGCTMIMSKHFYSYLPNIKLSTVNAHLGYSFNHHHASSDATACANILLEISKELQTTSITEISQRIGFDLGKLYPQGYQPASSTGGGLISKRKEESFVISKPMVIGNETTYFQDKLVAFTGPLTSMPRHEAIKIVDQLGGDYTPSVTLKTNLVITNVQNPQALAPEQMSTKLRRAMHLIERGQKIEFLTEAEFLAKLKPDN